MRVWVSPEAQKVPIVGEANPFDAHDRKVALRPTGKQQVQDAGYDGCQGHDRTESEVYEWCLSVHVQAQWHLPQ